MPIPQYTVAIDWDQDGDFDAVNEWLTRDLIGVEWALGLRDPADAVAEDSWAVLALRNPAGRYSPDNPYSPLAGVLTPRQKVRITAAYAGQTITHFTGWTEAYRPLRDGTILIRCSGVEALLKRAEVFLPLGLDQTADDVIGAALAQVAYPPAISGYWVLGAAQLAQDTRLPDTTVYADLERGVSVFPYVGDNWHDGISAWQAIRAVTEAERGLCFVDRGGRVIFWNRHHLLGETTVAATLSERDAAFEVAHDARQMINAAEVTCHPRDVSASLVTLWTLGAPLELARGESRTLRARYVGATGARIGGLDLVTPVPGTDYHVNRKPDGTGADRTSYVSVTMEAAATSAALTFTNNGDRRVYVLAGATLRGRRVADYEAVDARHEDVTSIMRYGRRAVRLNMPLLGDLDTAGGLAHLLVIEGRTPRGLAREVELRGADHADVLAALLNRTIGDRITLSDAPTGHAQDYHIVGERHSLMRGGSEHRATWVLRPASPVSYWRLGVSGAGELEQQTTLAY